MYTCMCNWVTMLYSGKKLYWGNNNKKKIGVPVVAQWLTNPTSNHEVAGSVPSLSGLRIRCCWELWCRSQVWLGSHVAVAG